MVHIVVSARHAKKSSDIDISRTHQPGRMDCYTIYASSSLSMHACHATTYAAMQPHIQPARQDIYTQSKPRNTYIASNIMNTNKDRRRRPARAPDLS